MALLTLSPAYLSGAHVFYFLCFLSVMHGNMSVPYHHRAFEHAVPTFWGALVQLLCRINPSFPSDSSSNLVFSERTSLTS